MNINQNQACKENQVSIAKGMILNQIERLDRELSNLSDRISPLLRNELQVKPDTINKTQEAFVPHAEELRSFANRLSCIADIVEDLKRRLEI